MATGAEISIEADPRAIEALTGAGGYRFIGMGHFAKEGDEQPVYSQSV